MKRENSQYIQDISNISSNNPSVKNNINLDKPNELNTATEENTNKNNNNNNNEKVKNKDSERRYGYDCLRKK